MKKDLSEEALSFRLQRLLRTFWKCGSGTCSFWCVQRLSWSRGHCLAVLARSLLTKYFAKCQEGMCELPERRNTSESMDSFFSYPDPGIIGLQACWVNGGKMGEEAEADFISEPFVTNQLWGSQPFCSLGHTVSHPFPRNGPRSPRAGHCSPGLPQDRTSM